MARLLYVIRSLPGEEFLKLFTLVPHAAKKKQPRRDRIRVIIVELLRFLNHAFRDHGETALSLLLPKRLGKHVICIVTYFSDTGFAADSCKISFFLEATTVLLSKYVQKASIWNEEKLTKKLGVENYEEADKEKGVKECKYLFQLEACQCYRCLYDVHILSICQDRKTGTILASLQDGKLLN
ncbi:unnamed protein product [Peronospora effusa]|nr:unnamed protein product [Peronospora effusa]